MAQEIERKFLLKSDFKSYATSSKRITQGYLSSVPGRTVRVRIRGEKGYLTVKGISDTSGISRFEWEKEISLTDAEALLNICEPGVIDKTRYLVPVGGHTYEVDEFHEENDGLVIAEIELNSVDEEFIKPDWLGDEVTGKPQYYNSMLSKKPYKKW